LVLHALRVHILLAGAGAVRLAAIVVALLLRRGGRGNRAQER
jgi:hypothetical protein